MSVDFTMYPDRLQPHIVMKDLNEPIEVAKGPFRLTGDVEGRLEADLVVRWVPSLEIAFDGNYSGPTIGFSTEQLTLASDGALPFSVPVNLTRVGLGMDSQSVRGTIAGKIVTGRGACKSLRFGLVNFPEFIGDPVRVRRGESDGWSRSRLECLADIGVCRIDEIEEVAELRKHAIRDAGAVVSHVGQWVPRAAMVSPDESDEVVRLLHFWFGFLRGAWTGPVFVEGVGERDEIVWRQFARWKLSETREMPGWFPERTPTDLSPLFSGFTARWNDPAWNRPLIAAISWLVEANSSRSALESRIVLAQVALDLLAWVHVVETQRLHSRADFKRLSAAGRIRALLHHIRVPTEVPDHLANLTPLQRNEAFDGPGVITSVRNSLVHATEDNRARTANLAGLQLLECSHLGLQYLELAILSICGHSGHYARRGWRGWKGEDEVLVPWAG